MPQQQQQPASASAAGASASNNASASGSATSTSTSSRLGILKYINIIAYVINVLVTYGIGTAGWFGLKTNNELSEKYQTLVTPIGYAFAIWGLIFVLQAIWSFQQLFDWKLSDNAIVSIRNIHYGYVFVVISQIAWTICFSSEFLLGSLVAMISIWWNLFMVTVRGLPSTTSTTNSGSSIAGIVNTIFQIWPFTIHFGWITAATIVNMNVVLVSYDFSSTILYYSAIGSVVLLVLLGIIMIFKYKYVLPPIVLCWACWGVYAELDGNPKESISENFDEAQLSTVQYSVLAAIGIIGICLLWSQVVQRFRQGRRAGQDEPTTASTAGTPYQRVQDGAGRL